MNITYIIGNGFDINLGLKTRYDDFYKWYAEQNREATSDVVKKFKCEISEYVYKKCQKKNVAIDWGDLELALGQYSDNVPKGQFRTLLLDITDNLKAYLKIEYSNFHKDAFDIEKFKSNLENPIADHFVVSRRNIIQTFQDQHTSGIDIRIISFNYTNTIEDLLDFKGNLSWESKKGQHVELKEIKHIHHCLSDENILVGVNDVQQISNKVYHEDKDVCDIFLKPSANRILGNYVDWECQTIIENTDIFVLYGTSVGETDRTWWNLIANRLLKSENTARMIWFIHDQEKASHANLLYPSVSRDVIPRFGRIAGMPGLPIKTLEKRIFVTLSNKMFSFPSAAPSTVFETEFST